VDQLLWKRIGELFAAARPLRGESRIAFLKQHCGGNHDLFEQVMCLLDADSKSGPLDSSVTVSSIPVPKVIAGRFRIIRYIAEGGMGTVYEAEDQILKVRVALKTIRPDIALDPRAAERFKREILLGKKVTHPNVCRIHDLGVDRSETGTEFLFLTMEFLSGETLASRIKRGPIPKTEAFPLIENMADALSAAHQVDVIHRDFKSGNVMLVSGADRACAVVTDFGLARGLHDSRSLTQASMVGTVEYMAPEQIRGEEITPAADIYALGIVMYEMATGQRPFTADSKVTVALKHLNDEPQPPRDLTPHLDPNWNETILHCLLKLPSERFQSAAEVKEALLETGVRSREYIPDSRQRPPLWAVIAVIIVAMATIFWFYRRWVALPAQKHIAVLPFHMTGALPQEAALFDGLTDTVTNRLMQLTASQPVGIIPFSEITANHVTSMQEARTKLGANLALDGNLQRIGDKLQVNLALSEIESHKQLRADTVMGTATDFNQLEERVVDAAVRVLELELHKNPPPDEARNTTSREAYEAFMRGRGYLDRSPSPENLDSALTEFTRALELDPGYAAAFAFLGRSYWEKYQRTKDQQWVSKMRNACEHSCQLLPSSAVGNVCLGMLDEGTGHYEQAASEFQLALDSDPTYDVAYRGLASSYEHLRRMALAEQTYNTAIQAHPEIPSNYAWLGSLYAQEARYAQAAEQYKKAVALAPDGARYWSSLGGTYLVAGKYPEAEHSLQKAISLQPSYEAYTNLGDTYFLEKKFPEAIGAFEQSVVLGDRQIQAYGNLARAYYWYAPDHTKAKGELMKAIELAASDLQVNPNDADVHTLAAEYFAMLGDQNQALQHLHAAQSLRPGDAETAYSAAKVYNLLGDRQQALNWLEKSVNSGYSAAEISNTIELDSLRSDPRFKALNSRLHS
jgi:tetratricopeptide (TPR) repeat protein/tRNA A-37 threonylcarbamoyl transferase component Bud32